MPQVLFLGICLDFYYFLWQVLLPKFGFYLDRGSVSQALVEPSLVPPGHPFERRDFYLDNVIPPAGMDQPVGVGAVNVVSQSIVIGVANRPGGSGNPVLGKSLVVDNADILRPVIRMVNHTRCFLGAHDCLVEHLTAARLEVRIESDSACPTILREYTSVTNAVYTKPFLVRT